MTGWRSPRKPRQTIAIASLVSAARGFQNERLDWGFGWGLIGVLLLAAGVAALVGTWWHQTRVRTDRD